MSDYATLALLIVLAVLGLFLGVFSAIFLREIEKGWRRK